MDRVGSERPRCPVRQSGGADEMGSYPQRKTQREPSHAKSVEVRQVGVTKEILGEKYDPQSSRAKEASHPTNKR